MTKEGAGLTERFFAFFRRLSGNGTFPEGTKVIKWRKISTQYENPDSGEIITAYEPGWEVTAFNDKCLCGHECRRRACCYKEREKISLL